MTRPAILPAILLDPPVHANLAHDGLEFVPAAVMRPRLEQYGSLVDWPAFAASWERMPEDGYMSDGGRYRRRRHAVYAISDNGGTISRQPHQPHYQSRDYNPLNGGLQRWFEPIEAEIGACVSLTTILRFCADQFEALRPQQRHWRVEVHQFRIEASATHPGLPTPEGIHRDGVDYVLVLLVRRTNIVSGTTTIHAPDGTDLGSFTLTEPLDATLIDDQRVFHGVTPVQARDRGQPGFRDVLVVTFRHGT